MANTYRIGVGQFGGTGKITINGTVVSEGGIGGFIFIDEFDLVTVEVDLDEGYNSFEAIAPFGPYTTSPFSFSNVSRDILIRVNFSGEFAPIDGYGLKYFWDWKTVDEEDRRLEIYEDGFGGLSSEKQIKSLNYRWGNLGDDILTTMIGSKIEFELKANSGEFNEFLTGENRKFKSVYYHGQDVVFEGYVNTDRLLVPEKSGDYFIKFEALDGVRSFESTRFVSQRTPSNRNLAIGMIIGALNQTFVDGRNVNICADIFEDGMDSDNCLFEEFQFVFASIYEDGEVAKFIDGTRIVNELLYISQVLERYVKPFIGRVFLYKNEWYIVRLDEYRKDSMRFYKFGNDGIRISVENENNTLQNFDCETLKFGNSGGSFATRESGLIYNEFTSILKLGYLDQSARGGIYETRFTSDDFIRIIEQGVPTRRLKNWDYINATPFISPVISGALVRYLSVGGEEFCQISNTTSSAGLGDPNIGYIELKNSENFNAIPVLKEVANTLSIELEFMVVPSLTSITQPPITHDFAIMIRIGDNWLNYNSTTNEFTWSASENIITYRIGTVINDWNSLQINKVLVPEDGDLVVRLYQLVNNGQTPNQYRIRYRNFKIDVEGNEALSNSEIAFKSETLQPYNRVHPDWVTHIGDAETSNSLSAIKLLDGTASSSWSDDLNTSQPLQAIQVQNLANLKGRRNLRVSGKLFRNGFPNPTRRVNYDGLKWAVNYFNEDAYRNECEVQLIEVQ